MMLITLQLIVSKNRNVFLNFAPFCSIFVYLLPNRIEDRSHFFSNEVEDDLLKVLSDGNIILLMFFNI